MGSVSPGSGMVVDVDFGQEYVTELTFEPGTLTLIRPVAIPKPGAASVLMAGTIAFCLRRRRKQLC